MKLVNHPITSQLLAGVVDHVGWIVLSNPSRHNAISFSMWQALSRQLQVFSRDSDVRAVVMRGAGGKAFAAGADISEFEEKRSNQASIALYNRTADEATEALRCFTKPTIAMIQGYCIGGGVGLALACDIRIANDAARFGIPAARLGLGYDYEGVKALVDVVGPSYAKEIFYTAKQFTALEAIQMGLVNRVIQDAELESYVSDYAGRIVANAPLTIASIKTIINEVVKDQSDRDRQKCDDSVASCFASNDYIEGRTAFMQKRMPSFKGC